MFQKGHNRCFSFKKDNHSLAQMYLMIGTYLFVHRSLSNRYKQDIAKETSFALYFRRLVR